MFSKLDLKYVAGMAKDLRLELEDGDEIEANIILDTLIESLDMLVEEMPNDKIRMYMSSSDEFELSEDGDMVKIGYPAWWLDEARRRNPQA